MRSPFATCYCLVLAFFPAPAAHAQQTTVVLSSNPSTGPRFMRNFLPGTSVVLDGALVRVGTVNPLPQAGEPMASVAARFQEFARTTMGTSSGVYQNVGRLSRTVTGTQGASVAVTGSPICLLVYDTASESNAASQGLFCATDRFPPPGIPGGLGVNVNSFRQAYGGASVTLSPTNTVTQFTLNGGALYDADYQAWLLLYFPGGSASESGDPDDDGQSNILEYKAGTHPTQANSATKFSMSLPSATQASFRISPVRFGLRYIIQTAGPGLTSWTDAAPFYFSADAAQGTILRPVSGPRAYFRLKLEIPP